MEADDPALPALRAEFPTWHIWIGPDKLLHGQPRQGPIRPVHVNNADEMRLGIQKAELWIRLWVA